MKTLFYCITGSKSYGTDIESSDTDYKGVHLDDFYGYAGFNYKEQIEYSKDNVSFELKRFLELAQTANPTMLELLFTDDKFVITSSHEWDMIKNARHLFLTKKCRMSFGGYAVTQIKKAKGLNKKMNWEKSKMQKKDALDFCYILQDNQTKQFKLWLEEKGYRNELCGLAKLDHFRDAYALYYDFDSHYSTGNKTWGDLGFKGVMLDNGSECVTSSIPKGMMNLTVLSFNKDGYSTYCKEFKEYNIWLEERNTQRYVDVENSNQKIDGKNLLHCRRLLDMAIEIAQTGNLTVYMPNREYLLDIRRGKVQLDKIIEEAENDIILLDELYAKCNLPEEVNKNFVNNLLLDIRKDNLVF